MIRIPIVFDPKDTPNDGILYTTRFETDRDYEAEYDDENKELMVFIGSLFFDVDFVDNRPLMNETIIYRDGQIINPTTGEVYMDEDTLTAKLMAHKLKFG